MTETFVQFKNEWTDSTVAILADGTVVERFGCGNKVMHPQSFSSVTAWLNAMDEETYMCVRSTDYDEEDLRFIMPNTLTVNGRTAHRTKNGVVEGRKIWKSAAEWIAEVMATSA